MIWLARFAVLVAAITTLWFNGSYAASKATDIWQQAGLVAAALAIDLVKSTFLPVAAVVWSRDLRLRAVLMVTLLWFPALMFSTFCGYAAIATNRHASTASVTGHVEDRARLQRRHDDAATDLASIRQSAIYAETNRCTQLRTRQHRETCDRITSLQTDVETLSNQLGPTPIPKADPDLEALTQVLPVSTAWLIFLVAFVPAVLLELVAAIGSWAVAPHSTAKASQKPVARVSWWKAVRHRLGRKTHPAAPPEASGVVVAVPVVAASSKAPAPAITWKVPASAKPT